MTDSRIDIRHGEPADASAVLRLLDDAIAWMVDRGATRQWGTQPASQNSRFVRHVRAFAESGGLYLATVDGRVAGALSVGDAHDYVAAVDEPELYVQLLVTRRRYAGLGVGARLLDHARDLARERGIDLLRVDCFAGNDGKLVAYYEGQGFERTESFTVDKPDGPWPGQVLGQRLGRSPEASR